MGPRYIFVVILLTTAVAEDIKLMKDIFNIKANNEFNTNIAVENQNKKSNEECSGNEDFSKTMKLILFRPYIPELEAFATEINSNNNYNIDLNVKENNIEPTTPNIEPIDTTTAKHLDEHINKRNVNQEYTTTVKYPVKGDYSARIDVTSKPYARYEITENVIDVPDDRTRAGPVIHNFSPYRHTPLNLGTPNNNTEVKTQVADEDNRNTKSRFSILHIKAEVEENSNDTSKVTNFFKGVKNYLSGIKTGVVKGIHKLFKQNEAPHGKNLKSSNESDDEKELHDDDFAELHQTIHKGFR